jgi:hypothetical protein
LTQQLLSPAAQFQNSRALNWDDVSVSSVCLSLYFAIHIIDLHIYVLLVRGKYWLATLFQSLPNGVLLFL